MLTLRKIATLALLASALVAGKAADAGAATPWYVTIHAGEVKYDLARTDSVFQKAKDLGAKGVRTDIFWFDIEPTRDVWNTPRLQFYTSYVSKALAWGLDPLMILSGAPQWAKDLYSSDKPAFWAEYEEYVEQVVLWMGDRIQNYQMWNEANHSADFVAAGDDWQLFSRAGAKIDALDPTATTYVNVMADLLGWESAVTGWMQSAAKPYIDVIGIDHYPGTWACCSYTDWSPLDTLTRRINTAGDAWYGKKGAILETGYSSWAWLIADEYDQRDWINQSLPVVRTKINTNNSTKPYKIVLAGFYQHIDTCTDINNSNNCLTSDPIYGQGIEAHFGILHSDLTKKVGWSALKSQIALF